MRTSELRTRARGSGCPTGAVSLRRAAGPVRLEPGLSRRLRARVHAVTVHSTPQGRSGDTRRDNDGRRGWETGFRIHRAGRSRTSWAPTLRRVRGPRAGTMSHTSIQVLNEFRCRYPVRSHPGSNDAREDIRLGPEHGVRLLSPAPALDVKMGIPHRELDHNLRRRCTRT